MGFFSKFFGGGESKPSYFGPQATALADLYKQAGPFGQQASTFLQGQLPGLTGPAQGAYGSIANIANLGSPFLGQQIGNLGNELGNFFNTQLLPGINSQFGTGGTLGGARNQIAIGQAAGDVGRAFTSGATDLMGESVRNSLLAGGVLPGVGGALQNFGLNAFLGPWQGLAGIYGTSPGGGQNQNGPGLGYSAINSFLGGF
jgi:hypothetical protein